MLSGGAINAFERFPPSSFSDTVVFQVGFELCFHSQVAVGFQLIRFEGVGKKMRKVKSALVRPKARNVRPGPFAGLGISLNAENDWSDPFSDLTSIFPSDRTCFQSSPNRC